MAPAALAALTATGMAEERAASQRPEAALLVGGDTGETYDAAPDNPTPSAPAPPSQLSSSNCRRLIVASIFVLICALRWERELRRMYNGDPLWSASTAAAATLSACTSEESDWPELNALRSTRPTKFISVSGAMKVLDYIITKLDEIGAPIILMFGTALHEFRNGTQKPGPCYRPNYNDKDLDIAVFPDHFHYITSFEKDIRERFGWYFRINDNARSRLFTTLQPIGIGPANMATERYFQIDVYGFHCHESNDLIFFPWDKVTIAKNAMLPVRKHKLILRQNDSGATNTTTDTNRNSTHWENPGFYMPNDPHCLLSNIYGSDYMTPKTGKSSQAKWGGEHGRPAYYNPKCNSRRSAMEKYEFERQLMFCSGKVPDPG